VIGVIGGMAGVALGFGSAALIDTPMVAAMPGRVREKLIGAIPFGRLGQTTEVADVVAWLLSDQASYMTGQCVLICGGRSIR